MSPARKTGPLTRSRSKSPIAQRPARSRSKTPVKTKKGQGLGLKEQIIQKMDVDRLEDHQKPYLSFCQKKADLCLNQNSKNLIEVFENAIGLFCSLPEYAQIDSLQLQELLKKSSLDKNRTFSRLKMQNSMLQEATTKMDSVKSTVDKIKKMSIADGFFEENHLRTTKMIEIGEISSQRIRHEDFVRDLNYFNDLPKNNIFSRLRLEIDNLNAEMTLMDSLQSRISEFWNNYSRLEFLNCTIEEGQSRGAFMDMNHIFSLYVRISFFSEDLYDQLSLIELLTVGSAIDLGFKQATLRVFEDIRKGLTLRQESRESLLVERLSKKVRASQRLIKMEQQLRNQEISDFVEIHSTLEEFRKYCSNDFLKEVREYVETVVDTMKTKLKPLDEPKFITELQELLGELQTSPYEMKAEIEKVRKRILEGEKFFQKVKTLSGSKLRSTFPSLIEEYEELKVKINYFEELLSTYNREKYFISNLDSIVNEEINDLKKVFRIAKRLDSFRFHRATFANLLLFNKQIATVRRKYADWQLREGVSGFDEKSVKRFLKFEGLQSKHVRKMLKEGKRLKVKLSKNERKVDWTDWPGQRSPELELESLESNYIFFKRFLLSMSSSLRKEKKSSIPDVYRGSGKSNKPKMPIYDDKVRQSIIKEILRNLMKNQFYHFDEDEGMEISKNLERGIRYKLRNPKRYEAIFEKIIRFLRKIRKGNLKNVSLFIKNFEFKPKLIGRLAPKKDKILKKIERNLGEKKPIRKKRGAVELFSADKRGVFGHQKINKIGDVNRMGFDLEELTKDDFNFDQDYEGGSQAFLNESDTKIARKIRRRELSRGAMALGNPLLGKRHPLLESIENVKLEGKGGTLTQEGYPRSNKYACGGVMVNSQPKTLYEKLKQLKEVNMSKNNGMMAAFEGQRRGGVLDEGAVFNDFGDDDDEEDDIFNFDKQLGVGRAGDPFAGFGVEDNARGQNKGTGFGNSSRGLGRLGGERGGHVEPLNQNQTHFYYRLFDGEMTVDDNSKKRKIRNTSIYSAFGDEFIKMFTRIPEGLHLSTKLTFMEFQRYISKVLSPQKRNNYLVLPCFFKCENEMALKSLFKNQGRVASMEYSRKCKLFLFPREEIRSEWLDIINFVVVQSPEVKSFDLLCFLVTKLNVEQYEIGIDPERLRVTDACQVRNFNKNDFTSFGEMDFFGGAGGANASRLPSKTPCESIAGFTKEGSTHPKENETIFNWDDGMSLLDNNSKRSTISRLIDSPGFLDQYEKDFDKLMTPETPRQEVDPLKDEDDKGRRQKFTNFESFGKPSSKNRTRNTVDSFNPKYNLGRDNTGYSTDLGVGMDSELVDNFTGLDSLNGGTSLDYPIHSKARNKLSTFQNFEGGRGELGYDENMTESQRNLMGCGQNRKRPSTSLRMLDSLQMVERTTSRGQDYLQQEQVILSPQISDQSLELPSTRSSHWIKSLIGQQAYLAPKLIYLQTKQLTLNQFVILNLLLYF